MCNNEVLTLATVAGVLTIWPELLRLVALEHLAPAEPIEVIA